MSVFLLLGGAASALAAPFTWNPQAVGLAGTRFTADTLVLSDHAQIRFGNGGTTFVDTGYLPVVGFRLGGQAVAPAAYGTAWGMYISYTGTGTQVVTPQGIPVSAAFQTLTYSLVGFNGVASFGFAADGSAVVGGGISNATVLETGSLITGDLAFVLPDGAVPGQVPPTIIGHVKASVDGADPRFVQGPVGALDVTFVHPAGEYFFSSPATLQIDGGISSTAARASATVPVPEPASLGMLGAGLLVLAAGAGQRRG